MQWLCQPKTMMAIAFWRGAAQSAAMTDPIVTSDVGVTLAGGGPFGAALLRRARAFAPRLVAADGGADRLLRLGHAPEAVIGDFDSLSDSARAALGPARLFPIAEQETTDFDKALRHIAAPFVVGVGFAGARLDHGLAVFSTLVRHAPRPIVVLGAQDVAFVAPPQMHLRLPVGTRLSLFPMGQVRGHSEGLHWPIGGIEFHPCGVIGTSNRTAARDVWLGFDQLRMLVILPRVHLAAALRGLLPPDAPAPVHGG